MTLWNSVGIVQCVATCTQSSGSSAVELPGGAETSFRQRALSCRRLHVALAIIDAEIKRAMFRLHVSTFGFFLAHHVKDADRPRCCDQRARTARVVDCALTVACGR